MASTSFSNFPADDEVLIIDDDDSMDENSNEETASNDTVTSSSKVGVDQGRLPMECSNPWHALWGNNDCYFKAYQWPSQIPMEIMTIFKLLGFRRQKPSNKVKRKFCMTCINRAALLTEEEKMALVKTRKQSEEAQIQAQLEKLDTLELDDEEREMQAKQLRMLTFVNPGKFMEDFDPERSTREMKKMTRRIYKEKGNKKKQLYDENGLLISTGSDLCDCLEVECPGCHFPCAKCASEKCGAECRVNRRWRFDYIEVEGTGLTINWPGD